MKPIGIVLLVIAIILVAAMIVLYFLGKKAQKKKEEQDEQMKAAAQTVTMLIIDKKRMKMKDAGLPSGNGAGKQTHAARQTSNRKSQSRAKSHDTDRRRADLR